jgi:hypothetical protein
MAIDYFERDFGREESAPVKKTAAANAPASEPIDYFERDFTKEKVPVSNKNLSYFAGVGAGAEKSLRKGLAALTPAAEYLEKKLEPIVGDVTFGSKLPKAKEAGLQNAEIIKEIDQQEYPWSSKGVGTLSGDALVAYALMRNPAKLLGSGLNTLTKSSPLLEAGAASVQNAIRNSVLLKGAELATKGAVSGGVTNLLTSGGSEKSKGDLLLEGAEVGGPLGVLAPLAGQGGKFVGKYLEPLSEKGREVIASRIIQYFAGKNPLTSTANIGREIVPGSKGTMAEITANPGIAKLQSTLRDQNSAGFVERQTENAAARNAHLDKATGTPLDIQTATNARDIEANAIVSKLFKDSPQVDTSKVVNILDKILTGSRGKRDAVKNSLNNIRSKLVVGQEVLEKKPEIFDAYGNVMNKAGSENHKLKYETDAKTLYDSVRKQIGDLLDKSDLTNKAGIQAARELGVVKNALDKAITKAAPGFKEYLTTYHETSKPINAMEWLQGLRLTDAYGNITLQKVDNALENLTKLKKAKGVNNAKSVTGDQQKILQDIREDLLRKGNLTLGKSYGSNTVQNAGGQNQLEAHLPGKHGLFSGKLDPELIGAVLGENIGSLFGVKGAGTVAGAFGGKAIKNVYNKKAQLIKNQLEEYMLHPELYSHIPDKNGLVSRMVQNALASKGFVPGAVLTSNALLDNVENSKSNK